MGGYRIQPWYCDAEDTWYYFLPSCVEKNQIWCGELDKETLFVGDDAVTSFFTFEDGIRYNLCYKGKRFAAAFRTTTNLSTVFIETESGGLEYIHENKENRETGTLLSLDAKGNIEYRGDLDKISGHGNGGWIEDKKSYNIKLSKQGEPGGLRSGREWNLMALWYEGDKIHSKLAFDIASVLGAPYVPDCTWVNVYMNGNYMGLYLLAEAVNSFESFNLGRDEFLLEKDFESRYREEPFYIVTNDNNGFTVVRPKTEFMTQARLEGISQLVQEAENAVDLQDPTERIDLDSFAAQFLLEEISLNFDAFTTSSYIHKHASEEKIYAGPVWDYDAAFGEYLHWGEQWVDPNGTVVNARREEQLSWYATLYSTDEFSYYMLEKYEKSLPELSYLFSQTVDRYADWIADSVENDYIRWKSPYLDEIYRAGIYQRWENNVRYLKYFGLTRLDALCERWQIPISADPWVSSGEYHTVVFEMEGEAIMEIRVPDGGTIDINEISFMQNIDGGCWFFSYSSEVEPFNRYIPILEDCVLVYSPPS